MFDTVTVSEAVPTPPTGSVAVAVSVCVPLATLVVSQEKLGPVPVMAVPSAFRPYVYVVPKPTPLPPTAASVTVAVPVSVALAAGAVKVTVGVAGGGGGGGVPPPLPITYTCAANGPNVSVYPLPEAVSVRFSALTVTVPGAVFHVNVALWLVFVELYANT